MNLSQLLEELKLKDIKLTMDKAGKLKLVGKKELLTPTLIDQIKAKKDALLTMLDEVTQQRPATVRCTHEMTEIPLSYAQQRIWLVDKLGKSSSQYNIVSACKIAGAFDATVAQTVLEQLIQRHLTLRTTYFDTPHGPRQKINEDANFTLDFIDLTDIPTAQRDQACRIAITREADYHFDLSRDLMIRGSFFKLDESQGVLMFNMHHIASDGWSMRILENEFFVLYKALLNGSKPMLPNIPVQYSDYAVCQREWLQGTVLEKQLRYWTSTLAGMPELHQLPTDFTRPAERSYQGANLSFTLSSELSGRLRELAAQHNVTLFMLLHAVFALLVHKYSGQDDIVVGTPAANRMQKELEAVVGFFINSLVLRTQLKPQQSFLSFLQHTRQVNIDAQQYQDVPFDVVVEQVNPTRSNAYAPLYQLMFTMDTISSYSLTSQELGLENYDIDAGKAKFDLLLSAADNGEKIEFNFEYATDLFAIDSINTMRDALNALLEQVADRPDRKISEFELLRKDAQLRHYQEMISVPLPGKESTIHGMFERQASLLPDHTALVCGNETYTYGRLNRLAQNLASNLNQQGCQPGDVVAISTMREAQYFVAVLGILKLGAVFLPIDPDYPEFRKQHMLSDSGAHWLLVGQNVASAQSDVPTLVIDALLEHNDSLNQTVSSADPAYIIYTSGSTGLPKGVLLNHAGAVNLARAQRKLFSLEHNSHVLHFASISFDASVWELLMALANGACLYMCQETQRLDPQQLQRYLVEHRITHATLPPSVLRHLGESDDYAFDALIVAGEACEQSLADSWSKHSPFFNAYGPTETTVCASVAAISSGQALHLGTPIANVGVLVLDEQKHMVPAGTSGTLHISGKGLAVGYLNNPALTQDKFFQWTAPDGTSMRLYDSGDQVKLNHDGSLTFIGRNDDQVKLRGFRVELGEIRNQICALPGINDAEILLVDSSRQSQSLVAFIISEPNIKLESEQLQQRLSRVLPDYMLPNQFILLDIFPVTANGKVDKKALRDKFKSIDTQVLVPVQTETEQKLADIWGELLGVHTGNIGREANFFALGGHSLLSVKMGTMINSAFAIQLEPQTAFEASNLADLANKVDRALTQKFIKNSMQKVTIMSEGSL